MDTSSEGRVPDLVPVRYFRMSASPFTFMRGAPNIMAYDLARTTPANGATVQTCGDAHLQNFGIFATGERNVIFDINDFDETLPGPWEWDVKRLAASIHVAGRTSTIGEKRCSAAVMAAMGAYRSRMRTCAGMTALAVWYSRIDASAIGDLHSDELVRRAAAASDTAPTHTHAIVADDYTVAGGEARIADHPPKLFHPTDKSETIDDVQDAIARYRETLRDDIAVLLSRYHVADFAVKVVGVGSVGTRCAVALLVADSDDRLILQIKEARASVLEAYLPPSRYTTHGNRVVAGQRLMQAASDIFLGWTTSADGHDFYVRQVNDLKVSIDVTKLDADALMRYAAVCGEALALAHARSGDPKTLAGYLGKSVRFDEAITEFAARYADQNERDYAAFMEAIQTHRLLVREG